MTIGPAPMIRIDFMSVRFGIGPPEFGTQKKGALLRVLRPRNGECPARGVLRPESGPRQPRNAFGKLVVTGRFARFGRYSTLKPLALMIGHHFSISAFCRARQRLPGSAARAGKSPARLRRASCALPDRRARPERRHGAGRSPAWACPWAPKAHATATCGSREVRLRRRSERRARSRAGCRRRHRRS